MAEILLEYVILSKIINSTCKIYMEYENSTSFNQIQGRQISNHEKCSIGIQTLKF